MVSNLLKSRTFWVAVIQAVIGAVAIFATAYPTIGGLLVAKSVLDIALRIVTNKPISE